MPQLPRHIAIIMDGNGRWANRRNLTRTQGHAEGVERAREVLRECAKVGVEALTLYTFSTENWQRPAGEVSFLMKLLLRYLRHESNELIENNLRFRAIGFLHMLPAEIQAEIKRLEDATKENTGMWMNLALSYGSRAELTEATKQLALAVQAGKLRAEEISEEHISRFLFTHHLPEPDLLIRTGGDHRVSNFLLWQIAYAELFFTELCWPDFRVAQLHEALDSFSERERRYGKVKNDTDEVLQAEIH